VAHIPPSRLRTVREVNLADLHPGYLLREAGEADAAWKRVKTRAISALSTRGQFSDDADKGGDRTGDVPLFRLTFATHVCFSLVKPAQTPQVGGLEHLVGGFGPILAP
jgi:hypothetical protein